MREFKKLIAGVALFGWLIMSVLLIVNETNHGRYEASLKKQIVKLEDDYKKLDSQKTNQAYDYDRKVQQMKDKIDKLNDDLVDLEKKNTELRDDNQQLRLRVDELSTSYVESSDQPVLESENPTLIESAVAFKTENTYMEELGDDGANADTNPVPTGDHITPQSGTFNFEGHTETYYNLDMSVVVQVAQSRGIAGEYHVREDGAKMIGDYIMVAACYDVHPYGSLVNTSLGMGIVVDTGGFVAWNPEGIDIATTW